MLNLTFWIVVILLVVIVIEMLRRKVLLEKYAIVWIVTATLFMFGALFPEVVNRLSKFLGFQFLSNFVLFLFSVINLFIAMQLSLSLSKAEHQNQTLAEEVGLLNMKLKNLKD